MLISNCRFYWKRLVWSRLSYSSIFHLANMNTGRRFTHMVHLRLLCVLFWYLLFGSDFYHHWR